MYSFHDPFPLLSTLELLLGGNRPFQSPDQLNEPLPPPSVSSPVPTNRQCPKSLLHHKPPFAQSTGPLSEVQTSVQSGSDERGIREGRGQKGAKGAFLSSMFGGIPPPSSPFCNCHHAVRTSVQEGKLSGENGPLWPHQAEALQAIYRDFFERPDETGEQKFSLVVMPTGTGKSLVIVLAPYMLNCAKVLVITPSVVISKQLLFDFQGGLTPTGEATHPLLTRICPQTWPVNTVERYQPQGFPVNCASDLLGIPVQQPQLVVVNAQKLGETSHIAISQIPPIFDLIIVDEAHHFPAVTWRNIVAHFQNAKVLLMTATPYNKTACKLTQSKTAYILDRQPPAYQFSRVEAMRQRIIRPISPIYVEERVLLGGPEPESERDGEIRAVILRTLEELDEHDQIDSSRGHQAMVITHTKEEAVRIAEIANAHRVSELPEDLIAAVFLDGTPGQVLKDFSKPDGQKHRGTPRILIVCARLLEGYDNKNISVCVILRKDRKSVV